MSVTASVTKSTGWSTLTQTRQANSGVLSSMLRNLGYLASERFKITISHDSRRLHDGGQSEGS